MGVNKLLSDEDLAVIQFLDDGSLYAAPNLIEEMFSYPYLSDFLLLVSRNYQGEPTGYIPLGIYTNYKGLTASYIPAIPPSPPIAPTYTPGAENVIANLGELLDAGMGYFDVDVISANKTPYTRKEGTASAYCLPLKDYFAYLSSSRRKDFKRKLKDAQKYTIEAGTLEDIKEAWSWMRAIWEKRGAYDPEHTQRVFNWLKAIEASGRAAMKVDKYLLDGIAVGVNCCVIHRYKDLLHIDDYLTWYDASIASGLGIVSAINNITNPDYKGARYNLGLPGYYGQTFEGHEYKWHIFPKSIRLKQSIIDVEIESTPPELKTQGLES